MGKDRVFVKPNYGADRHVLELKKNLTSLGELDSNGCKVFVENELMRILKGAVLVLEAREIENLYVLFGNTNIGGVPISNTIF